MDRVSFSVFKEWNLPMASSAQHLIWIDLEMTGLVPEKDRIIEIATIVTDQQLRILAEGPVFAVSQPEALLLGMDDWNTKQHTRSGLVERVRHEAVSEAEAESETLDFLRKWVPENKSPMCGNSICQDRRFLYHYMPALEKHFHYRNLDVSTVKELAKHWRPDVAKGYKKKSTHLAMDDVKDSIAEMQYYRDHFFILDAPEVTG